MRHPLAIVDTETTGFDDPAPIEIAALHVSPAWTVTRAFYRRWLPAKDVEPKAAEKNDYTPEAWALCEPVTADDLRAFGEFVAGRQWAGSFPDFDFRALEPNRIGARLPSWDVATHRKIDVGSLGAPLCAVTDNSGGMEGICLALAALAAHRSQVPRGVPAKGGAHRRHPRAYWTVAQSIPTSRAVSENDSPHESRRSRIHSCRAATAGGMRRRRAASGVTPCRAAHWASRPSTSASVSAE